jgi:hypothetical protein
MFRIKKVLSYEQEARIARQRPCQIKNGVPKILGSRRTLDFTGGRMKKLTLPKMVLRFAVVGGSVLALALASSGARMSEIQDNIKQNVPDEKDRDELLKGAARYMDKRDAALQRLSGLTKDESTSAQKDRWISEADAIKDVPELKVTLSTDPGLKAFSQIQQEEQRWIASLKALRTAENRDQIIGLQSGLKEQIKVLGAEWGNELGKDATLDEEELKITAELYEILSSTINDVAASWEKTKEAAKFGVGKAASMVPLVGPLVKAMTNKVLTAKESVEQRKERLKKLVDSEKGGILVLFRETRAATDTFVKTNGFDKIKATYQTALSELKDFEGFGTSGQQSDTKSWSEDIKSSLGKHVSNSESVFNEFVKQNMGKFFGPVSPEITEQLIETKVWEGERGKFEKLDLDGLLKRWRDDDEKFADVSLSGFSNDEKETIMKDLKGDLENLLKAVDAFGNVINKEQQFKLFDRRILEDEIKR